MTDDQQVAAFTRMMDRNMAALNEYTAPLHERIAALEAAALAIVQRFVLIPNSDAPVCMVCDTFVWPHADGCLIGALEVLLEDE